MRLLLNSSYPQFTQCIAGILRENVHYALPNAQGEVELKESDNGGNAYTLQSVILTGLPVHAVVFSADALDYNVIESQTKSNVWKDIEKYRRVSDYVVLFEHNGELCFLYIEMKTSANSQKYISQLRCARGQIEHLVYLIRYFNQDVLPNAIKHRFVKFYKMPPVKKVTSGGSDGGFGPVKPSCNDEPPKAYQYEVEEGDKVNIGDLIL